MSPAPLAGLRVVVTRAVHQSGPLAEAFNAAGARVELLPLLEIGQPRDPSALRRAAGRLETYDWLVFTSTNAVDAFSASCESPPPPELRIAAVGEATAAALRRRSLDVDLTGSGGDARSLAGELAPRLATAARILVPQADDARPSLVATLRRAGARVTAVEAYTKRLPEEAPRIARRLFDGRELGWVTFTSPRIVRHFVELLGTAWPGRRGELSAISVGPVTTAALRRHGVEPATQAARPGPEEIVAAVVRRLTDGVSGA